MAIRVLPLQSRLVQLFRYDADKGFLFWQERPLTEFPDHRTWKVWHTRYCGKRAGYSDGKGHRMVRIDRVGYFEHRIIWAMHHGECVASDIDHIDGDGTNNRLGNLRAVTHSQNARNMKRPTDNKSGVIGISRDKRRNKWVAEIGARTTRVRLGQFDTLEEAAAARREAERRFGYHPNHGR